MDKKSPEIEEETLVSLLASFRKNVRYDDNFEESFLRQFQQRRDADRTTHSAWSSLLDRLDRSLQNFTGWKWVYSSIGAATLFAVGWIFATSPSSREDIFVSLPNSSNILENAVPVSEETMEPLPQAVPDQDSTREQSEFSYKIKSMMEQEAPTPSEASAASNANRRLLIEM